MRFRVFESGDSLEGKSVDDIRLSCIVVKVKADGSVNILSSAQDVGTAFLNADAIMIAIQSPDEKMDEA